MRVVLVAYLHISLCAMVQGINRVVLRRLVITTRLQLVQLFNHTRMQPIGGTLRLPSHHASNRKQHRYRVLRSGPVKITAGVCVRTACRCRARLGWG